MSLTLTQDPAADALLSTDPFALLTGMLLDQQFPMERAFAGPHLLAQRLGGDPGRLDPATIVATDDETLKAVAAGPPAIHRYPGSMVMRVKELARTVCDDFDGDAAGIWRDADSGTACLRTLRRLPGFGDQKARIFLALLGKQYGLTAPGWREAAGDYGAGGTHMSVADVRDKASLDEVRSYKKQMKAAAKAAKGSAAQR